MKIIKEKRIAPNTANFYKKRIKDTEEAIVKLKADKDYNNHEDKRSSLLAVYSENLKRYESQLQKNYPEVWNEVITARANDCTVTGATEIS